MIPIQHNGPEYIYNKNPTPHAHIPYKRNRFPGVSSVPSTPTSPSEDSVLFRLLLASGVARTSSNQDGESGTVDTSAASPSLWVRSSPLGEEKGWPSAGEDATQSRRAGVANAIREPPPPPTCCDDGPLRSDGCLGVGPDEGILLDGSSVGGEDKPGFVLELGITSFG